MRATDGRSGGLGLSSKARRTVQQPISYLISAALANPQLVNLAAGLVDPLTLPVDQTAEIAAEVLAQAGRGRRALQYGSTQGVPELRHAALRHLEALEGKPAATMGLSPDDLIITTGSQQALYLIGDCLIDPGDIVIAANPSYFVYTGTLSSLGAEVLTVPMDEAGMDVPAVGRLLEKLEGQGRLNRVKFIYCTSYFQNPTGLTLAADRRPLLLEIAQRFSRRQRILILEDAAYRELRYDGPALPSIKSFDANNHHTILTATFSKPFAPGIKTGFTAMPPDLLGHVLQQKGNHDFGSAHLCQHIALTALESGRYHEHVKLLQQSYRAKRDEMMASLERHFRGTGASSVPHTSDAHNTISWTHPTGGLYVWLTLPPEMDTSRDGELFQQCLENGVLFVPGDYCFQSDERGRIPRNHIRLSFGQVAIEQIDTGIARLAGVIRASSPRTVPEFVR